MKFIVNIKLMNFCKYFLITSLIGISALFQFAYAASSGRFSVRAVIPENQLDKNNTYFDLRLSPGEKQTIQVIVENSENEDIIAKTALNPASTGRNGLIVYNQPEARDESLKVSITDIAKVVKPEVTVPAKGTATVEVEITMTDTSFDGVILGGLVFTAEKASANSGGNPNGLSLNNEYAYIIGLKITENDTEAAPDFELNSINPGLVNYRNAVVVNVRNKKPLIVKAMTVDAKIYKKDSNEVFRELVLDYAEMAPNSNGDFVVDWQSAVIEPGTYRLGMTVRYQGKEWVWDEEFVITRDVADDSNKNAVDIPTRPVWLYVLLIAGVILIAIFAYLIGRREAKKE